MPHVKFVLYEKSGPMPVLEERAKFQEDAKAFIQTLDIPGMKLMFGCHQQTLHQCMLASNHITIAGCQSTTCQTL